MGFVMPHIMVLIAAGAVGLALLFQIVGVATPGWVVVKAANFEQGLWKICKSLLCVEYPAAIVPVWLKTCRSLGILGVLAMTASLACALLICFMNEQKIFTILAPVAAGVGAFCTMAEFGVWAGNFSAFSDYFGYSFALTVVAFLLSVVAAVLFSLARGRVAATGQPSP